ncbi:MAG: lysophospholipid acyltransferase family protein [bacterium]
MIYILLRYIFRYRIEVIRKNLRNSFPEKSDKEIEEIVNKYYKNLSSQIVGTFQQIFVSKKTLKKRCVVRNIEFIEDLVARGHNPIVVFGHFGNYELLSSSPLWSNKLIFASIYKRINNRPIEKMMKKIRERLGTVFIEKKETRRRLNEMRSTGVSYALAVLADQTPSRAKTKIWIDFLNQPTPVISGWTSIARNYNDAVVFLNIIPKENGHYEFDLELLTENPKEMTDKELCEAYMHRLEKEIIANPSYWMWSHKRWKYTPTDDILL